MPIKLLLLSRELESFGGVVNLVIIWKKRFSKNIEVNNFTIGGRRNKKGAFAKYIQTVSDALRLVGQLKKNDYDILHINPSLNLNSLLRDCMFLLVARLSNQKTLIFFHGWDESLSERIRKSAIKKWLMRITFGSVNHILVLATGFRQQLIEMGIDGNRISMITTMFDGVQLEVVRKPRDVIRGKILFLSRFVREKGLFELIDAFARISKEFPDAYMILAGDGPVRLEVEQVIIDAGLSERVKLPGYLRGEDKVAVLSGSDIFVLPSYSEGCPVSMLEAMAAGLAIISTPVGGIPDILHDGENGVLLKSADPDLIYDALHRLLSSPELLMKICLTNQEVAWRCYEAGVITAEIEEHYKKALIL